MTLTNLAGKTIEKISTNSITIQRLIDAAKQNIKDSKIIL